MSASLTWIVWNFEIGLAERAPLLGVGERLVERALREAEPHRRDADAPDLEHLQELREAAPRGAEQAVLGHAAVGERQRARVGGVPAHLAVRLALLVAGRAVGDEEVRDLALAGQRGDRHEPGDVGAGVRDELLGAVDDPVVAVAARARRRVRRRPSRPRPRSARRRRGSRRAHSRGIQSWRCSSVP